MLCKNCGEEVAGSKFCPNCGASLKPESKRQYERFDTYKSKNKPDDRENKHAEPAFARRVFDFKRGHQFEGAVYNYHNTDYKRQNALDKIGAGDENYSAHKAEHAENKPCCRQNRRCAAEEKLHYHICSAYDSRRADYPADDVYRL